VSPSWNETLRASLSPGRVSLVRLDHRKRLLEGRTVECTADEAGEPAWAQALDAFREGLAKSAAHHSRVAVVLSNHFVRYVLVPWNGQIKKEEEELAYARHCFEQVYGPSAAAWDIRVSASGKGGPRVACAVDARLLSTLDQIVAGAGMKLSSVQPYLMTAFNRWRDEMNGHSVWFVLAEQDRLCLSTLVEGRWTDLKNLHVAPDWIAELPTMLERQRLLSDLGGEVKVYLCASDENAERTLLEAGESVHSLHLPPTAGVEVEQARYLEMACCG
jgi:hypothetical protein